MGIDDVQPGADPSTSSSRRCYCSASQTPLQLKLHGVWGLRKVKGLSLPPSSLHGPSQDGLPPPPTEAPLLCSHSRPVAPGEAGALGAEKGSRGLALNLGPPTHPYLASLLAGRWAEAQPGASPWGGREAAESGEGGPPPGQALPSGNRRKDKGSGGEQPGRAALDWDLPTLEYLLARGTRPC